MKKLNLDLIKQANNSISDYIGVIDDCFQKIDKTRLLPHQTRNMVVLFEFINLINQITQEVKEEFENIEEPK
jgi:hypothetical protein